MDRFTACSQCRTIGIQGIEWFVEVMTEEGTHRAMQRQVMVLSCRGGVGLAGCSHGGG
ncbi:MAG: hypothetical protein VX252_15190 [Myxococcota bacterium]|nr:hypothetical protein [Myxococcota bacterium]